VGDSYVRWKEFFLKERRKERASSAKKNQSSDFTNKRKVSPTGKKRGGKFYSEGGYEAFPGQ